MQDQVLAGPMPEPLPDTGENSEVFKNMSVHIWAAGASLEDADFITRMLTRKGLYLFETKPWERCPSTHCERRKECCSPRDCTIKSPSVPNGERGAAS